MNVLTFLEEQYEKNHINGGLSEKSFRSESCKLSQPKWDKLPTDIKLLIINQLDDDSRFNFCQTDVSISNFCRKYKLTAADSYVKLNNPRGQLIQTRAQHADLIKRGFQTVFSLVLYEDEQDNGQGGEYFSETNIPHPELITVQRLEFGVDQGTIFYERKRERRKREYKIHVNVRGLPPKKGELIKVLFVYYSDETDKAITDFQDYRFEAFHLDDENLSDTKQDLIDALKRSSLRSLLEDPEDVENLLIGERVIIDVGMAMIFNLPSP